MDNLLSSVPVKTMPAWLIVTLLAALIPGPGAMAATNYYVSVTGTNTNPGTEALPWRTIQKAADTATAGDTVYIRAGTYRETVTPGASGTAGNPITFEAYGTEEVTISGMDIVDTSWSVHSGNIYVTTYTMGMGEENQVFVDGAMADLARWPNNTDSNLFTHNAAIVDGGSSTEIYDADMPNPSTDWYKGGTVWCQAEWKWTCWGATITGSGNQRLYFTIPGDSWIRDYQNPSRTRGGDVNRYYISGLLGLLDKEMEWHYDATNQKLYLWVTGGGSPSSKTVEVRARKLAFNLTRSYINVNKIRLKCAAVNITGNYNTIDRMTASYAGHHSGREMHYTHPVDVYGIHISGHDNTVINSDFSYSAGNLIYVSGDNTTIDNNYLSYSDYNGCYDGAIIGGGCGGVRITRNTMHTTGRALLQLDDPTTPFVFMWNDLSNAMLLTDDGGLFYFHTVDLKDSVMAFNKFHDSYGTLAERHDCGPYFDDGSANAQFHHNVIYNVGPAATFKVGGVIGGIKLYNNTSYNCPSTYVAYHSGGFADIRNVFNNQSQDNFMDAAGGDFRLTSSSTAINAGAVISGITDGYVGGAPDLGAYEYGANDYYGNWQAGVGAIVFDPLQVAPPLFSPAAGAYDESQTVTITSGTSGATIRYTTDGSTPSSSTGTIYSSAVTISNSCTLRAIACKSGLPDSAVTSGDYAITIGSGISTRMRIDLSGYTNRTETLTNFPVLVVFSNNVNGSGFTYSNFISSSGYDLRFATNVDDTTSLNYEIEKWDPNGSSYVWVQVPRVPGNGSGVIWAKWGDIASRDRLPCTTNGATWDTDYKGVWHFAESSGTRYDTTAHRNTATPNGAVAKESGIAGQADRFKYTDGDDYDEVANSTTMENLQEGDYTIESWFRPNSRAPGTQPAWDSGYGVVTKGGVSEQLYESAFVNEHILTGNVWKGAWEEDASSTGVFHHVVSVVSRTLGLLSLYVDGQLCTNDPPYNTFTPGTAAQEANQAPWRFGIYTPGRPDYGRPADGAVDEVRFSSATRSSNYVWACWLNAASNEAFCTYGAVQATGLSAYELWRQTYFTAEQLTNSAISGADADPDGDRMNNLDEFYAGTIPTNTASVLCLTDFEFRDPSSEFVIRWQSASNRRYTVQATTNLLTRFAPVDGASNIPAAYPVDNVYTDDTANVGRKFYRIRVDVE